MQKKQRRHLFFINGPVPTAEQQEEADGLNGLVCFRNRLFVRDDEPHAVEAFDELHGDIPPVYQRAARAKAGVKEPEKPVVSAPPAGAVIVPPKPKATSAWKPN